MAWHVHVLSWILLLACCSSVFAADRWQFGSKIAVGAAPATGVFHHLEGAGRKHIAVSAGRVAIVWEDNSSGDPQVYLALKQPGQSQFSPPILVSAGAEAYEPAIAAGKDGFVLAYEQDTQVYVRAWTEAGLSAPQVISAAGMAAGHATVAALDQQAIVAWREQQQRSYRLRVAGLDLSAGQISLRSLVSVEDEWLKTPVLMPSVTLQLGIVSIAWEDRRAGHTRLLTSMANALDLEFSAPGNLNEFYSNRNEYDKGNGVTRVALAPFAEDEVVAAWMDKRRGGNGYGIFAALGFDSGASYGPNEKVHGAEGDELPHYNPAVAGNAAGDFIVVWDDFRNGDLDIWLSSYTDDGEWSKDFSPAVASGQGEQSHASVTIDNDGGLHLVWVDRADNLAPTRLWYSRGQLED